MYGCVAIQVAGYTAIKVKVLLARKHMEILTFKRHFVSTKGVLIKQELRHKGGVRQCRVM